MVSGPSSAARTGSALRASGTIASVPGAQQPGHRDRDRAGRNVGDGREVAFAHLLELAAIVELDDLDDERVVEVGDRRVVEREVPVLADTEAAEIDRVLLDQARVPRRFALGIARRPVDVVKVAEPQVRRDPLAHVALEARRDASARDRRTRPCGSR